MVLRSLCAYFVRQTEPKILRLVVKNSCCGDNFKVRANQTLVSVSKFRIYYQALGMVMEMERAKGIPRR